MSRFILLTTLGLLSLFSTAQDYKAMYSQTALQKANLIYSKNIQGLLFEDLAQYLTFEQLTTLKQIQLFQPWDRVEHPFDFISSPARHVIVIPTFSVKFLDEVAIATAWLESKKCNTASVYDYIAAMSYGNQQFATPLKALNIPENAYQLDRYVDDVSQKILKSALAFIVLHELGHVHFQHQGYANISKETAIAQELQSDQFAMNIMKKMRTMPLGMIPWFMAVSSTDPLSEKSANRTHPMSYKRLQAIANSLRQAPHDFISYENRGRLQPRDIIQVANQIESIGKILSSSNFRSFIKERGRIVTPDLLKSSCDKNQHDKNWLEHFYRQYGATD